MVESPELGNNAIPWHALETWPVEQRPAALWPWLSHAGSLTERLRADAGNAFHVRVLHEGRAQLDAEDARLLRAPTGAIAHKRQVYLCADMPWVYACTLAPLNSSHWLDQLGAQPLGERVFSTPGTRRGLIEVARLYPEHRLYKASLNSLDLEPPMLWARRSVLMVGQDRLLIYECFLPGMDA